MYKYPHINYFSMKERREKEIVLKAMGQAISKTVAIAEIIKVCINFHSVDRLKIFQRVADTLFLSLSRREFLSCIRIRLSAQPA